MKVSRSDLSVAFFSAEQVSLNIVETCFEYSSRRDMNLAARAACSGVKWIRWLEVRTMFVLALAGIYPVDDLSCRKRSNAILLAETSVRALKRVSVYIRRRCLNSAGCALIIPFKWLNSGARSSAC